MLEALKGSDRVGAVAYQVRGYPLVEHMRWTVADGGLGELRVCTAATSATTLSSFPEAGACCPNRRARPIVEGAAQRDRRRLGLRRYLGRGSARHEAQRTPDDPRQHERQRHQAEGRGE